MKKTILFVLMLLLLPTAYALDMCTDTREINTNCTMLTPEISCAAYNYSIHNITGDLVSNGSLDPFAGSVRQFNFTEGEGDYIITLCDGTTREARVAEEDEGRMIIAALIIAPLLLGLMLVIAALSLGPEHSPLKIFLFLLSLVTFITSLHFGMHGVIQFYDMPGLQGSIGTTTYWFSISFMAILAYFIIYMIWKFFASMAEKKRQELEY